MSATARVFQAPEKRFQVARILVCAVFLLLPFVISLNGLDKFRTPKDIAASVAITVNCWGKREVIAGDCLPGQP